MPKLNPAFALFPLGLALVVAGRSMKARAASSSADGGTKPKTSMQRVMEVIQTGDPAKIRELAEQVRSEGDASMADRLEQAAVMAERMRNGFEPLPSTVDAVTDPELLNPSATPSQDDRIVEAWLRSDAKGAPKLTTADTSPRRGSRRRLTAHERWVLDPYFAVKDDLTLTTIILDRPPSMPKETIPPNLWAATMGEPGAPLVYFPQQPEPLLTWFWMCVLAHELIHVSQLRLGLRGQMSVDAIIRYGYTNSPIEIQARYFQRIIRADLLKRARAFFESVGVNPDTL